MVKPEDVEGALTEHFDQITLEEFKDRYAKSALGDTSIQPRTLPDNAAREVILSQMEAAPLPLNAYLASALTGLSDEERQRVFAVSDLAASVCEDLAIEVYEPRKSTDPVRHPDVLSEDVFEQDRERVLNSDLVIHIADYASTGAGEELDFALAALIPIVLISRGRFSRKSYGARYSGTQDSCHVQYS